MYTLLLVDDDRAILEMLSLALDRPGLHLLTARNKTRAAYLIGHHPVDAAVLDVQLTTANQREGLDLLRLLRQNHPNAQAIVLTGAPDADLEEAAYDAGAVFFLRKPLSLPDLQRELLKLGLPDTNHQRPAAAASVRRSAERGAAHHLRLRPATIS